MVKISKELLLILLEFAKFEVSVVGNDIYYTVYDREHYSSQELTREQGMELQELKHIIVGKELNNKITKLTKKLKGVRSE